MITVSLLLLATSYFFTLFRNSLVKYFVFDVYNSEAEVLKYSFWKNYFIIAETCEIVRWNILRSSDIRLFCELRCCIEVYLAVYNVALQLQNEKLSAANQKVSYLLNRFGSASKTHKNGRQSGTFW